MKKIFVLTLAVFAFQILIGVCCSSLESSMTMTSDHTNHTMASANSENCSFLTNTICVLDMQETEIIRQDREVTPLLAKIIKIPTSIDTQLSSESQIHPPITNNQFIQDSILEQTRGVIIRV